MAYNCKFYILDLGIVDTKCWAFCPPGGLVSANLSAAMAPFCTSVIVGKVSHLRIDQLQRQTKTIFVWLHSRWLIAHLSTALWLWL